MDELEMEIVAVQELASAIATLRKLKVIRSRRFTGDIGEWYVTVLYEAEPAECQTQKGWDICCKADGCRLQVKTQSYDAQNKWNYLESDHSLFDRLLVVVLTDHLTIKSLYDIPTGDLLRVMRIGKENKPNYHFSDLEPWRVDVSTLPGYRFVIPLVEREALRSVVG